MESQRSTSQHGFIRKHWAGGYSFARSFWLHTILLSWFVPIAALNLLSANSWRLSGRLTSVAFVAILLTFYPLLLWGMLGTARACKRYQEGGGRKLWASSATVAMTFLLIDSGFFFLGARTIVMEHVRMAFTGAYGPPASIRVVGNGTGLLIMGDLRQGSAKAFALAMTRCPGVTSVALDSPGGLLQEADLLAKNISRHGLNTYVEGECSSACTFVFLAGKRRCMAEGARIGFHAASYVRDLSRMTFQQAANYERDLYLKAGLPATFVNTILATPNRGVWYPTHQELREAGVTTPDCP